MTNKRKNTGAEPGPSTRRRKGNDPPVDPPQDPDSLDLPVGIIYFSRKCKVSTLLHPNYNGYRDILRNIAEEFSVLRRDAINFALFILIQFMSTQQIEIRGNYARRITNIQLATNQLVHDLDFARQLQIELQNLNQNVEVQRVQQEINTNNTLNDLQNQLEEFIAGMEPNVRLINTIVEDIQACIALEEPNYELMNDLHFAFNEAITAITPTITRLQQFMVQVVQIITGIKTNLENLLPDIMNMLPEQERIILQTVVEARNLQVQHAQHQNVLRTRMENQRRPGISNADAVIEQQLATQIRVYLATVQSRLQRLEEYEARNQDFLQQNEHCQHYFLTQGTAKRIETIIGQYGQLFQQVEIIGQQLTLMAMAEQINTEFPNIMNVTFWSHLYRRVATDPDNLNQRLEFVPTITRNFDDFDISRKRPGFDEYLYQIPSLDIVHRAISINYGSTVIQNITMHLLNIRLWIVRIFKGFFIAQQQPDRRLAIMGLANRVANSIINHTTIQNFTFQGDENAEDFQGFTNLYNRVYRAYNSDFGNDNYEEAVNDYSNAQNHPLKYLRASYRLLKIAIAEEDLHVKLWNLLPDPGYSVVHAPLSGSEAMYGLFTRAFDAELQVPNFLIGYHDELITITQFKDLYAAPNDKRRIWETIFNLNNLQKGLGDYNSAKRLGYGIKTDGHMISILFEKDSRQFIPLTTKDIKMQKRNVDLENWQKGIYPMYKNPTGITINDRIIGIDPGVRDIICGVDCQDMVLSNRYTTKLHSFSYSNASYKLRSGMDWIKQKELNSRGVTGIQASYDRLNSRKICSNEGLMNFLNSSAREFESIHNFMRSYRHRENKGYTFSNRSMALDSIARLVLGSTNKEEPFKLCHTSSSKYRSRKRLAYRRKIMQLFSQLPHPAHPRPIRNLNEDARRTVVAYGDASIRGTYKGNTPIPVKLTQRAVANKSIVIPVDEFRTSVTCSHCLRRLENVFNENSLICTHRKRRIRLRDENTGEKESRAILRCVDEEGNILHRSSVCPEAQPRRRIIYPLKQCPQCPMSINTDIQYWNRDVNAATNIREILVRYITQGFDLNSRQPQLSRIRELNAEEEEEVVEEDEI